MNMKTASIKLAGRVLMLVWLTALGVTLVAAALTTDRRTRQVEENPSFCDPFGYLQMAQEIRHSAAAGTTPEFVLETPHTRLLIKLMQSQQVPLPIWDEMVAPLAYHYFPVADHVAVQYSPGAGLALSAFPEGRALHGLNRFVIAIFLIAGLIVLVVAAVKRLPLAAGFFILALNVGLEILANLNDASFSVNALLAPLLLSGLCLAVAGLLRTDKRRSLYLAWVLTLIAGLLFGFSILARIPTLLMLPGVVILLWPEKLRTWYKSALLAFTSGVFLGGVLPLAIHQSRVAGAWYLPTYGHENTLPHKLEYVWPNVSFYLNSARAGMENWVLPVILVGLVGLIVWLRRAASPANEPAFVRRPTVLRLLAAAVLMLVLSNAFFLTHAIPNDYYQWPAVFGAVLLLALGAFALERHSATTLSKADGVRRVLLVVAFILSLAPGLIVMKRVRDNYLPPTTEHPPKRFLVPAELADESAWLWSDGLSGTFWYYARKPTHKITSTDADTRELVFRFVKGRGEPQYLINDFPSMQAMADEIIHLGGTLEPRGQVDGYPYFLIHWPPHTP
jgi:hypothetical protein